MKKERFFAVAALCECFLIATSGLMLMRGADSLAAGITMVCASVSFLVLLLMVARM